MKNPIPHVRNRVEVKSKEKNFTNQSSATRDLVPDLCRDARGLCAVPIRCRVPDEREGEAAAPGSGTARSLCTAEVNNDAPHKSSSGRPSGLCDSVRESNRVSWHRRHLRGCPPRGHRNWPRRLREENRSRLRQPYRSGNAAEKKKSLSWLPPLSVCGKSKMTYWIKSIIVLVNVKRGKEMTGNCIVFQENVSNKNYLPANEKSD